MAITRGTVETLDEIPAHVWKGLPDCLNLGPSATNQSRVGEYTSVCSVREKSNFDSTCKTIERGCNNLQPFTRMNCLFYWPRVSRLLCDIKNKTRKKKPVDDLFKSLSWLRSDFSRQYKRCDFMHALECLISPSH